MVYCGNNANSPRIQNEGAGTRYKCLQAGIGVGKALPPDPEFTDDYEPIIDRHWYCGKKNILPEGYTDFGSNSECLQIGVGIGKRQKYLENASRSSSSSRRRAPIIYEPSYEPLYELQYFASCIWFMTLSILYLHESKNVYTRSITSVRWKRIVFISTIITLIAIIMLYSLRVTPTLT